jgi:surface protein
LEEIDFGNSFNTSKVTTMTSMFSNCTALKKLDLSRFSTIKATTMSAMFNKCEALRYLDLSTFDTSLVTDMQNMFKNCTNLEFIIIGNSFDKLNGSTMFTGCSSLRSIITTLVIDDPNNAMDVSTSIGLNSTAALYVPNVDTAEVYRQANLYSNVFGASRIRPILEVNGTPKDITIAQDSVYGTAQDKGASIAGFSYRTERGNPIYTELGYSITETGLPVDTTTTGNKTVTYTGKKGTNTLMTATRQVTVQFVDSVAPFGSLTILNKITGNSNNEFVKRRSVTLKLFGQDNVAVTNYALANENARSSVSWQSFTGPTLELPWRLSEGDGSKTVYLMFKDGANNTSVTFVTP